MVVVALSTIIMGAVISLLVALMQRDQSIRLFAVQCQRQSELAEMLRADIRQAEDVSLPAETMLVVTAPDGGQTRYELAATGCRRIVTRPGEQRPGIVWFAIGPALSWVLEKGPPGQRPLLMVTLTYSNAESGKGSARFPMLVYAALGGDLLNSVSTSHAK
jgi:hypothetical protein